MTFSDIFDIHFLAGVIGVNEFWEHSVQMVTRLELDQKYDVKVEFAYQSQIKITQTYILLQTS